MSGNPTDRLLENTGKQNLKDGLPNEKIIPTKEWLVELNNDEHIVLKLR